MTKRMPAPLSRSRFARLHPQAYLAVHILGGFLLAAAASWAFSILADELPERGWMMRLDSALMSYVQARVTEAGESAFVVISYLGSQVLWLIVIAVAAALAFRRHFNRLVAWMIAAGGGALLNVALKTFFQRARPPIAVEFHPSSWSFPSGHAMNSVIIYGMLAVLLAERRASLRTAIVTAAFALIGIIGFSRVYLGVHYPSDVLAGYCAGLVWLAVCLTALRFARRNQIGSDR
jgi:undecaprenyl-diphosphatase